MEFSNCKQWWRIDLPKILQEQNAAHRKYDCCKIPHGACSSRSFLEERMIMKRRRKWREKKK
jgi:hypothetical protein